MTVIARICEQWTMHLEPPDINSEKPWFLDWVLRSPRQCSHHLTAGWLAYSALRDLYGDDISSAHECFGGMGAQSLMIDELWGNTLLGEHTVGEISWEGLLHLEKTLPSTVHPSLADAYDPTLHLQGVDLVGLDFGDLTAWKTREGEKHRALLDRTFDAKPKGVVFTDISCRYLHLHRERYESLLGTGTCDTYPNYLRALLQRFEDLYGYRLVAGYWDRWSAVMALAPVGVAYRGDLFETPDSPVGLELF